MEGYWKRHWRRIVFLPLAAVALAVLGTSLLIGHQVGDRVDAAQEIHGGAPIPALLSVAGDEEASLRERDGAVWALGQLGAEEALPLLRSLHTGEPCDHEKGLCQEGLAKAIGLCEGGANLGAVVWRHGDLAAR